MDWTHHMNLHKHNDKIQLDKNKEYQAEQYRKDMQEGGLHKVEDWKQGGLAQQQLQDQQKKHLEQ